jgi:hypothetical protein
MGFVKREEFDQLAAEVQRLKQASKKAAPKKKVVKK